MGKLLVYGKMFPMFTTISMLLMITFDKAGCQLTPAEKFAPKMFETLMQNSYINDHSSQAEYDIYNGLIKMNFTQLSSPLLMEKALEYIAHMDDMETTNIAECLIDSLAIVDGATNAEIWALKFLDSWGKLSPGILEGNRFWTGSYGQCMKLVSPSVQNHTDFVGQYCNVVFGPKVGNFSTSEYEMSNFANSDIQVRNFMPGINIGACVPDSCSNVNVQLIVSIMFQIISLTNDTMVYYVYCQPTARNPRELSDSAIGVICMLSVFGAVMVLATVYDIIVYQPKKKNSQFEGVTPENNEKSMMPSVIQMEEYQPELNKKKYKVSSDDGNSSQDDIGIGFKLLLCFSVYTNGAKVWNVESPKVKNTFNLDVLHGMRFLSMTWVMLGHSYSTPMYYLKNPYEIVDLLQRFSMQTILGATVSVDSFFFLSGTLVSYLTLKEMYLKGGVKKISWPLFYFHRYWRLTPPYMLVLGCNAALLIYFGNGPIWPTFDTAKYCRENWWTNLLYINNLVNSDNMCFSWSWYLANDMQFFVISPLFLIPLFLNGVVGILITFAVLSASIITSGVLSANMYVLPLQAQFSPMILTWNHSQANGVEDYYFVPWTRIGPYLVGILLGYVLIKTQDKPVKMHWALVTAGWICAAACNMSVVYGLYGVSSGEYELTNSVFALYNAFFRTAWAVGLAWLVFACVNGYGGFITTILSWKALIPLSRMSFMAYLVHPIVISVQCYSSKQPIIYDDFTFIYLFLANVVISYMVAFVVSMAFESPTMALEKVIFKRQTR